MGKDLRNIFSVIGRWKWLVIVPVVITLVALGALMVISPPAYAAVVTLQVTTPDREDISIENVYTWTSDRDEVTIAGNTFVDVAKSDLVIQQTMAALNLTEEFDLAVESDTGSDLVTIEVKATDAELAAEIANTHADIAQSVYGINRSLPSTEALVFFQTELDRYNTELAAAETALLAFRDTHGIVDVTSEIDRLQGLLTELETSRNEIVFNNINNVLQSEAAGTLPFSETAFDVNLIEIELQIKQNELEQYRLERDDFIATNATVVSADTATATGAAATPPVGQSIELNRIENKILTAEQELAEVRLSLLELQKQLVEEERTLAKDGVITTAEVDVSDKLLPQVDALIDEQRERLSAVAVLEPEYNTLVTTVDRVRENQAEYTALVEQATAKRSFTELVTFLQIISEAGVPDETDGSVAQTMILGLVASLGLGLLLAFFSDYFFGGPSEPKDKEPNEKKYVTPPSPAPVAAASVTGGSSSSTAGSDEIVTAQ